MHTIWRKYEAEVVQACVTIHHPVARRLLSSLVVTMMFVLAFILTRVDELNLLNEFKRIMRQQLTSRFGLPARK
ncbi:hypothetical protein CCP3SC1_170034 [Gammaproteobacteria bacterium]